MPATTLLSLFVVFAILLGAPCWGALRGVGASEGVAWSRTEPGAFGHLADHIGVYSVRVVAHTVVWAQGGEEEQGRPEDLKAALGRLRDWLMWGLAALATVVFTVGAVRYLLANGQIEEIEAAKRAFKSAAFGYALAVLAPAVVAILRSIAGR